MFGYSDRPPRPGGGREKERSRGGRKEQARRQASERQKTLTTAIEAVSKMADVLHRKI